MRRDWFGTAVAVFLAFALVAIAWGLTTWVITTPLSAEEQCIRDIPNDIDAQEIVYMEQECQMGVSP